MFIPFLLPPGYLQEVVIEVGIWSISRCSRFAEWLIRSVRLCTVMFTTPNRPTSLASTNAPTRKAIYKKCSGDLAARALLEALKRVHIPPVALEPSANPPVVQVLPVE